MRAQPHLIIHGAVKDGGSITVPPAGARLGRSSKNDIVLDDPLLSRHHCRLYFKPGAGLHVTDLASANETLVNDHPVQDQPLQVGDRITVGGTVLEVANTHLAPEAAVPSADTDGPVIDLGLGSDRETHGPSLRRLGRGPLLIAMSLVVLLALIAWLPRILRTAEPPPDPTPLPTPPARDLTLEISYEKVQATPHNVFRYHLTIDRNALIAIQIDDIENHRHVRKEKRLDPELAKELAEELADHTFFTLPEEFVGIQPNVYDHWDLTITIGKDAHQVRVMNRVEPEEFKSICTVIEEFGRNELGLWAIQFSPEKLRDMASDAYLQGRKYFDERDVEYGNLAKAIRSFDEAEWYLETVEPKPDYFAEIISRRKDCTSEQKTRYDDHNFRAERSIKLRDWTTADTELQIILKLIPDRSDPRNVDSRKRLIDVQRRLNTR